MEANAKRPKESSQDVQDSTSKDTKQKCNHASEQELPQKGSRSKEEEEEEEPQQKGNVSAEDKPQQKAKDAHYRNLVIPASSRSNGVSAAEAAAAHPGNSLGSEKSSMLFEAWLNCSGNWRDSQLYITCKYQSKTERKRVRKWFGQAIIDRRLADPVLASKDQGSPTTSGVARLGRLAAIFGA